ncbi:hypothetical protein K438DRAFT_1819763 [Mycena galopus ATCC 62051]|nr:hypothetical protein K438DRAFT_1819763 [Mycena galopus ATCC 62051]
MVSIALHLLRHCRALAQAVPLATSHSSASFITSRRLTTGIMIPLVLGIHKIMFQHRLPNPAIRGALSARPGSNRREYGLKY